MSTLKVFVTERKWLGAGRPPRACGVYASHPAEPGPLPCQPEEPASAPAGRPHHPLRPAPGPALGRCPPVPHPWTFASCKMPPLRWPSVLPLTSRMRPEHALGCEEGPGLPVLASPGSACPPGPHRGQAAQAGGDAMHLPGRREQTLPPALFWGFQASSFLHNLLLRLRDHEPTLWPMI